MPQSNSTWITEIPTPEELRTCRAYLASELQLLPNLRVVVALGRVAFDAYLSVLQDRGLIGTRAAFSFGHDREQHTGDGQPLLISSYHPSQQNTQTGRLTREMFREVLDDVQEFLAEPA